MTPLRPAKAKAFAKIFQRRYEAGELTIREYRQHIKHIKERLQLYVQQNT